jgi:hypothetical protein
VERVRVGSDCELGHDASCRGRPPRHASATPTRASELLIHTARPAALRPNAFILGAGPNGCFGSATAGGWPGRAPNVASDTPLYGLPRHSSGTGPCSALHPAGTACHGPGRHPSLAWRQKGVGPIKKALGGREGGGACCVCAPRAPWRSPSEPAVW